MHVRRLGMSEMPVGETQLIHEYNVGSHFRRVALRRARVASRLSTSTNQSRVATDAAVLAFILLPTCR